VSPDRHKRAELLRLIAELGYAEAGTVLVYQADTGELVEYWTEDRIATHLGHTLGGSATRLWCGRHNVPRKRFGPLSPAAEVLRAEAEELGPGFRSDLHSPPAFRLAVDDAHRGGEEG